MNGKIRKQYINAGYDNDKYEDAYQEYQKLESFRANENVEAVGGISAEAHFIMRQTVQFYIEKAFEAMRIDLNDPNVQTVQEEGNIGTPGRIAKVWTGFDTKDMTELGSGRWCKKPRLASFPNTNTDTNIPITKRVDLISNCSHHFISFNTVSRDDSYAVISYIPDTKVLGISKLQRLTDWVSRRFWLQEDLTKAIYDEISKAAETDSVFVKLVNITHGCEQLRGAQSSDGAFSSEMFGGKFTNPEIRKQVDRSI